MSLFCTDDHNKWREKVRQFAENTIKPIAPQLDENEAFSIELTKKMGRNNLFGVDIPKKCGGQGLDSLSYIIAVEELARIDGSQAATMCAHNSLGVAPIYLFGSEDQKQHLLPKLCSGEHLWAFGLTEETAGSDARGVQTTAQNDNDHWIVNGTKRYITNGSNPLMLGITVLAITNNTSDKHELSTLLIERDSPGFETERMTGKMMWRASDTAQLAFNNVKIPSHNLLGQRGKGLPQMLKTLDGGRLSIAAMGLGLAQGAFEMALTYANERTQFNKKLNEFQGVSFKLADMAMKLELARNTLYHATLLKDKGLPFGKEAAMAKLYCSEIAKEVSDEAVQIFGGAGLFKSNDIERFYRDQRILQIGEGSSDILRLVIARHLGIGK